MKIFIKPIVILLIGLTLTSCKKKKGLMDEPATWLYLLVLLESLPCTDKGPYHYFGSVIDMAQTPYLIGSSNGECWARVDATLPVEILYSATGTGRHVIGDKSKIYYTVNGTEYIAATIPALSGSITSLNFINNSFYATTSDSANRILKSADGITWTKPALNLLSVSPQTLTGYTSGTSYLMAFGNSNICPILNTSTDSGANWTQPGACSWIGNVGVYYSMSGNSIVIGMDYKGQIARSTDNGLTLTISTPFTTVYPTKDYMFSNGFIGNYFYATAHTTDGKFNLARSSNGLTWTHITTQEIKFFNKAGWGNIKPGLNGRLVTKAYYSDDNGSTWVKSHMYEGRSPSGEVLWDYPSGDVLYIP